MTRECLHSGRPLIHDCVSSRFRSRVTPRPFTARREHEAGTVGVPLSPSQELTLSMPLPDQGHANNLGMANRATALLRPQGHASRLRPKQTPELVDHTGFRSINARTRSWLVAVSQQNVCGGFPLALEGGCLSGNESRNHGRA